MPSRACNKPCSAPGVVSGGLVEIRNPGRNPGPKKWKSGIRAEIRSPKSGNPESGQKSGPKSGNPESGQTSGAQKAEIRNPGRSPEPKKVENVADPGRISET